VMDIKPTQNISGFGVDVMVSFLTTSASAVGVANDGRGKWALSARRGNLDLVVDLINPSLGNPTYSDWFGSYSYQLSPETELEFGIIAYNDDVTFRDGDDEQVKSRYRNTYVWAQLNKNWSDRSSSITSISFGSVNRGRRGFMFDEEGIEGSGKMDDQSEFDLINFNHRYSLEISSALNLELGGRLNYQRGRYQSSVLTERGLLARLIGLEPREVRNVQTSPAGTSGYLYGSTRWLPREWLAVEAGLRWDYQDYGENFDQQFSPRLSVLVDLASNTKLRMSAGRFYQAEQIQELQAADGVDQFQDPQYADHFIVGLSHDFGVSGLSARIEGFYKAFKNPKSRFENLFNSLVLLPELAFDRIEVAPSQARARGVEATLRYQPRRNFNAWLSYTRAAADDKLSDGWARRGWDQTHTVSTGFMWNPANWSLSAAFMWHSGWKTTLLPDVLIEGETPSLERNADRLPNFSSFDLKLGRTWDWPRQSLTVFAEVTNVFNTNNVGAYEYDLDGVTDGAYQVTQEGVTLLPMVPSLGVRWTFE
ncbi:MAG: TonB-dependent receptor plug domain-containing protein, partial [Pseudomonadales bacterium]